MQDSIFTKIVKGEIPCHKVYEDDKTIAFLDIYPIRPGHTLVVPKKQQDHFETLEPEDYEALFLTVKKVAKRVKAVLGVERACLRLEGFDVPHAHVHVIPCDVAEDFYNAHRMEVEPNHAALAELAKQLYFEGEA